MSVTQLPATERRRILEGFYTAYANRDVDGMMQWVTDDIVEDISGIGFVRGAAEERAFLSGLFSSFPDLDTRLVQIVIDDHGASVEWSRRGTFEGTPFQGLRANGRAFQLRGGAFFEFSDGRIRRITGYYDTAAFARDIGLLPKDNSLSEGTLKRLFNLRTIFRRSLKRLRRAG
ncbi:hypothetical protein D3874_21985 [Oleomonas cavernae]|uniref:SnoaL-like domain-containing protein n=1 Tax=Oleomonas cavernae TaxID=2320859 RepID=A0A418WH67_9PROT|nr:nuclear transport factor 2 family protein [Oleomonas cavernae]RJF89312.1 hypothetical protein D3874_21985 [Oleomonas cavernae]